jgi:prevent-host-death family protein
MKLMTATEASRNFAAVLDAAEHGETIVITRAGRRLALVGPAPTAGHRPDDRFAEDVSGARDLLTDEPGAQWPDA